MRRTPRGIAVVAVMALAGAHSSRASSQDVTELERHLDSAVAQHTRALATLSEFRNRPVAQHVFTDTVVVLGGEIRFLTDAKLLPIVRDASARLEPFLRERAGSAVSLLHGTSFAVWSDTTRRARDGIAVSMRMNDSTWGEQSVIANVPSLTRSVEVFTQNALGYGTKKSFAAWLATDLPLEAATNSQWRGVRLELVSSPMTIARRCFDGALAACRASLGLALEADPAIAWYDSVGRRWVAENARRVARIDARNFSSCLRGVDADCIALLHNQPSLASWLSPPMTGAARLALVQEAFSAGGAGALARLAASEDSPSAALAAIAGMPVDSVVMRWQRHAHDGGVQSESAAPVIAASAFGWFLLMGAAASRSSRWR